MYGGGEGAAMTPGLRGGGESNGGRRDGGNEGEGGGAAQLGAQLKQ